MPFFLCIYVAYVCVAIAAIVLVLTVQQQHAQQNAQHLLRSHRSTNIAVMLYLVWQEQPAFCLELAICLSIFARHYVYTCVHIHMLLYCC